MFDLLVYLGSWVFFRDVLFVLIDFGFRFVCTVVIRLSRCSVCYVVLMHINCGAGVDVCGLRMSGLVNGRHCGVNTVLLAFQSIDVLGCSFMG